MTAPPALATPPVTGAARRRRGTPHAPGAPRDPVRGAVARALLPLAADRAGRVVLAVSGGLDSMSLLDAAVAVAPEAIAAVATFDHGTGEAARRAAALVETRAAALGLPCVRGEAPPGIAPTEAAWRAARWTFLRHAAGQWRARAIVTAHTADDQAETVFIRAMRGAGARGLAALAAPSGDVLRPLLGVGREELRRYAARRAVAYVEDPSNASRRHLRNRVRLDLLPAIERARPGFRAELLSIGARAAAWRGQVDALVAELAGGGDGAVVASRSRSDVELRVRADVLAPLEPASLGVLWPALAALVGVALDRRGTRRLAEFTMTGRDGGAIQLSGGLEVVRRRGEFVLRTLRGHTSVSAEPWRDDEVGLPTTAGSEGVSLGAWRFEVAAAPATDVESRWRLWVPAGASVAARPWRAGDRMRSPVTGAARRVKRYFGDAGVAGVDRAGWPVVVADGEIVWIPGVRRAHAAPAPSGRPGVWLTCRSVAREPTHR